MLSRRSFVGALSKCAGLAAIAGVVRTAAATVAPVRKWERKGASSPSAPVSPTPDLRCTTMSSTPGAVSISFVVDRTNVDAFIAEMRQGVARVDVTNRASEAWITRTPNIQLRGRPA